MAVAKEIDRGLIRDVGGVHAYLCAWVESWSEPFICSIETLKCLFEKTCFRREHVVLCGFDV